MDELYYLRKASIEDAENIADIMQRVYNELPDKSIFVCDDLAFVEKVINESGFAIVACTKKENNLAGCFLVNIPGLLPNNLGRDIGLPEDELLKVAHMDSAVVLPEHRGHHLERKMLCYAEKQIDRNKYKYLMSTASPDNPASCKSLEKCGYECQLTKEKYKGLIRRVYMKRIPEKVTKEYIEEKFKYLKGKKSFYYKNLITNEMIEVDSAQPLQAASVIKIPVMIAFFNAVKEGIISENDIYVLKDEDKLPSCGCLNLLHENIELSYLDLCSLMITLSDNTATNILIKKLGIEYINRLMKNMGYIKIELNRLLFDSEASAQGLENYVSAKEIADMLEKMYNGTLIDKDYDEKMLSILKNQKLNGKLPFYFERKLQIAHKTGEDAGITHDVGIIFDQEPFIICCMGNEVKASAFEKFMQDIAWELHLVQEGSTNENN